MSMNWPYGSDHSWEKRTLHTGVGGGVSLTRQSFRDEADINKIIARFEKTGMTESLNSREPFYGDVSELVDYHACLNIVHEAQGLFNQMSAEIRNRFDNDPRKMIEFLDNPANLEEAISLGMAVRRPEGGGESAVNAPGSTITAGTSVNTPAV